MRSALSAEVVALHDAGEALTFAGADDVYVLHVLERLDGDRFARLPVCGFLQLNLMKMPLRTHAGLAGVADLREAAELGFGLAKPELNRVVAVGLDGLHLRHGARTCFDNGDG